MKMLPERHFRGHHGLVSEREPDVVPRGSMSACAHSSPQLPSFLCHDRRFRGFMKAVSGGSRKRCREWSRRKVVLKDIMPGWSCEAPGISHASTEL